MSGLLSATHDNLGVIALVVHPGASGRAVGSNTHRDDRGNPPDEPSPECALDTAGSTPAGATAGKVHDEQINKIHDYRLHETNRPENRQRSRSALLRYGDI